MPDTIQRINLTEQVGDKSLSIQTGTLAKQAGGSVTVHLGDTVVLSAATAGKSKRDVPFITLTSDYRERTYAAGRIPGGFFKRETRPRDKEILSSRLVDRPIRPLLPEDWRFDTMVQTIVISSDGVNDTDVISITGASASLMLSDIPFSGPVAGVRVAIVDGEIVPFPTFEERDGAELEIVVAGKKGALLMVEGTGREIAEDRFIQALEKAAGIIDRLCDLQLKMVAEAEAGGRKIVKRVFEKKETPKEAEGYIAGKAVEPVKTALHGRFDKFGLEDAIAAVKDKITQELEAAAESQPEKKDWIPHIRPVVEDILYAESRAMALHERTRPDGRAFDEVRPIDIKLSVLNRLHGSVVFTRGQTQSFSSVTLGSPADMQIMDVLEGEYKERFMLHYNFPAFCVGEVKPERGPGRRDIGHGTLAQRSLAPLLPNEEDFAYTIRVVSEILESNGSSSMATVCGGSLALFDAGVPMKAPCAGLAMGLVIEGDKYAILTDIAGIEDHNGDMDFKVAGTAAGITGFQMDMKVEGLSINILKETLEQAKKGRLHILGIMNAAIDKPRAELSPNAPRLFRVHIPIDKIGGLIGPGGKNIRRLIETYGVDVNVEDDGSVFISGTDALGCEQAKAEVEAITVEAEVGKIYKGHVVSIKEFGAFVEILPGKEGLLHISQIDVQRVARVEDVLKEGDAVEVKVLEVDNGGKIRLSRKAVLAPGSELEGGKLPPRGGGGGRDRGRDRDRGRGRSGPPMRSRR